MTIIDALLGLDLVVAFSARPTPISLSPYWDGRSSYSFKKYLYNHNSFVDVTFSETNQRKWQSIKRYSSVFSVLRWIPFQLLFKTTYFGTRQSKWNNQSQTSDGFRGWNLSSWEHSRKEVRLIHRVCGLSEPSTCRYIVIHSSSQQI